MNTSFGQKIKEARKNKHLTQKQLADLIEAKHNSVSDWENDKNKPDPDTIELLCGALEITPNYLLATDSDDFSPTERQMIKKYRDLDAHGKDMVDTVLDKEHARYKAEQEKIEKFPVLPPHLAVNAAHERTDTDFTVEDRQADEDMLD
ncbi:MAG: helix-turn-helix transcriptional regulator [Eubacteriales bacterium]|nr:helix-turn-helix transcriptional regulator [Eubacteriales bacterium]